MQGPGQGGGDTGEAVTARGTGGAAVAAPFGLRVGAWRLTPSVLAPAFFALGVATLILVDGWPGAPGSGTWSAVMPRLAGESLLLLAASALLGLIGQRAAATASRASAEVKARDDRYALLVDSLDDIVYTLDPDGRFASVHGNWLQRAGLSPRHFLGLTAVDLVGPEQARLHEQAIGRALAGEPVTYEWSIATRDGLLHVQSRLSPMRDAGGALVGVVGVGRDITDLRRMQEQLEQYRLLAETTPDSVFFIDRSWSILDANAAAERVYGYTREEFRRLTIRDLRTAAAFDDIDATFQQLLAEPDGMTYETVHRRRDGTEFPAEVSTVVRRIGGEPVLLATVRDITRRQRTDTAREILHELDQQFLAARPLDDVLQFLCETLATQLRLGLVWIGLDNGHGRIVVRGRAGREVELLGEVRHQFKRADECPASRQNAHFAIDALTAARGGRPWRDALAAHGLVAELGLALRVGEENLGILGLYAEHPETFDADLRGVLMAFADQLALSIQAAQRLARSHIQTAALEAATHSIIVTARNGRIEWVNAAFTRLNGYTRAEAIGQTPRILKSGIQPPSYYRQLWETILAGRSWHGEVQNRRKDGTLYLADQTITPVRDDAGNITHFVGILQDMTEQRRLRAQVRYLERHDPVTGLPNRGALKEALAGAVGTVSAERPAALVLVCADGFQRVVAGCGFAAADGVLREMAARLHPRLEPGARLFHVGADEFAILLPGTARAGAVAYAQSLQTACPDAFTVEGRTVTLPYCLAATEIDGTVDTPAVTAAAGAALRLAASTLPRRVMTDRDVASPKTGPLAELGWAHRLREALRHDRFTLALQPIVALDTEAPAFHEALVRLRDDDGSLLAAGTFLPAALQLGLMPDIDRWVLMRSLDLLARRPDLRLSVNMSAPTLDDDSLLDELEAAIEAHRIAPGRLIVEITETAAFTDIGRARVWADRLSAAGCAIALDDFGVGYSSFDYIRAVPADYMKLDGSYVRELDTDSTSRALVEAITSVAHRLGKAVVAEMVESAAVASILRDMGVEYGQGYYWGRPAPVEA